MKESRTLNYKQAGVDIDAGNALVDNIKNVVKSTHRPEVMSALGGFGALCALPSGYREPLLVSSTDGVGTKLRLALDLHSHTTIGIDLVAMCVNDLIVQGAEPLFFLDYFATGKLDVAVATEVISGIAAGCKQAGCALVGGETAEMPGMYQASDYDLAGFSVGVVEKDVVIDGRAVRVGDALIALASSGPHANGYSLIRQVLKFAQTDLQHDELQGKRIADLLMAPTRIYVRALLSLLKKVEVHAMAHITGGGFWENIPRVLPAGTQAVIDSRSWQWPAIFQWLQQQGNIESYEMYRTFNCGVGMVIVLPENQVETAITHLNAQGESAWRIGHIAASQQSEQVMMQ